MGFSPLYIAPWDLPTIWMLPIGYSKSLHAKVKVVQPECLLELGRVRFFRDSQHCHAVVVHIVAPDLVGAIGKPIGMLVIGGHQQQLGRIGSTSMRPQRCLPGRFRSVHRARPPPPVTVVPLALVVSLMALALVSSVTFGYSSAGRTPITSASDLACTRHGKPSHVAQRMQVLNGLLCSLSIIPFGEWKGW